MTYKQHLEKLRSHRVDCQTFYSDDHLKNITVELKKYYPGNYRVEEHFNSKRGTWDLRLVFENDSDQTLFVLKWE